MNITDEGLQLIKAHEGCRLKSYPDPGSGGDPWTIGYGHTGPEVVPGLTITQEQADGASPRYDAYGEPVSIQQQYWWMSHGICLQLSWK